MQQTLVALALSRACDEHQRVGQLGHPVRRRRRRWGPTHGADQPYVRRPVAARVLKSLGGERQQQGCRSQQLVEVAKRWQIALGPQSVEVRQHGSVDQAPANAIGDRVPDAPEWAVQWTQSRPEWRDL